MGEEKTPQILQLEEALRVAGNGLYTKYVIFVAGFVLFAATTNVQMLSIVIPVAKCDLEITPLQKGFVASASFAGMTLSSHLFGFLADMVGRRKILLLCLFASAVLSLFSSLSPNTYTLASFWFAIGFMSGGLYAIVYVYVSEFCSKEIRARAMLGASAMGALATGYLPYLASLIVPLKIKTQLIGGLEFNSWRLFIAIFPITNLLPMLLLYYLPESPKFSLNEGKQEETLNTLKNIYSVNNRACKEEYPVKNVILDSFDTTLSIGQKKTGSKFLKKFKTVVNQTIMLFSNEFALYTIVFSIIMMGILGMYNAFVLWLPDQTMQLKLYGKMHPNLNSTICGVLSHEKEMEKTDSCDLELTTYVPTMVVGLAQFVVFLFISTFADKVNKKYIIVAMCGISAAGCVALEYVHDTYLIVMFLGMVITVLITTYPVALSIAVEFYPTLLRSTAASIILMFARISIVILTSFFGYLYHAHCKKAYWLASFILICVAIITVLSPSKRKETEESKI